MWLGEAMRRRGFDWNELVWWAGNGAAARCTAKHTALTTTGRGEASYREMIV